MPAQDEKPKPPADELPGAEAIDSPGIPSRLACGIAGGIVGGVASYSFGFACVELFKNSAPVQGGHGPDFGGILFYFGIDCFATYFMAPIGAALGAVVGASLAPKWFGRTRQ